MNIRDVNDSLDKVIRQLIYIKRTIDSEGLEEVNLSLFVCSLQLLDSITKNVYHLQNENIEEEPIDEPTPEYRQKISDMIESRKQIINRNIDERDFIIVA